MGEPVSREAEREAVGLFGPTAGASFSSDRQYRYHLWRQWGPKKHRALFVMLNPSTADEYDNDPTIRRCIAFAQRWGYDGLEVCNIFAYRSTDPKLLPLRGDPIGPENDMRILEAANQRHVELVVAAWGNHGELLGRGAAVLKLLTAAGVKVHCLGKTAEGQPRHPLYIAAVMQPVWLRETCR